MSDAWKDLFYEKKEKDYMNCLLWNWANLKQGEGD